MKIERATVAEIEAVTGYEAGEATIGWIGSDETGAVGAGGLSWRWGRCWLWLNLIGDKRPPAASVWRMAHRAMSYATALGETEVWSARDAKYDTSERLLTRLGFRKTNEMVEQSEVWSCRVSN